MDISALKKEGPLEAWVPFGDGVKLKVAYLRRDEIKAILKRAVKVDFDPKSHEKTESYDTEKGEMLICQAAVKDWQGLMDGDKPFECTAENVRLLVERWSGFATFVNRVCVDLQALVNKEKAATEKN